MDKRKIPLNSLQRAEQKLKRWEFAKDHKEEILKEEHLVNTPTRRILIAKAREHMGYAKGYIDMDIYWSLLNALKEQHLTK